MNSTHYHHPEMRTFEFLPESYILQVVQSETTGTVDPLDDLGED